MNTKTKPTAKSTPTAVYSVADAKSPLKPSATEQSAAQALATMAESPPSKKESSKPSATVENKSKASKPPRKSKLSDENQRTALGEVRLTRRQDAAMKETVIKDRSLPATGLWIPDAMVYVKLTLSGDVYAQKLVDLYEKFESAMGFPGSKVR